MNWRRAAILILGFPLVLFSQEASWEKSGNNYALYYDGKLVEQVKTIPAGYHLLVYHQATNRTFLLEKFYQLPEGERYPAEILSSEKTAFWYRTGQQFNIIEKGVLISGLRAVKAGYHLIAYDTIRKATYVLPDYDQSAQGVVYPALYYGSDQPAIWYKSEAGFWVFEAGKGLTGIAYVQTGDDLLIYSSTAKISLLLPGFTNIDHHNMQPAQILSRGYHIYWRKSEDSFWIYDKAKTVEGLQSQFESDDLVCFHPESGKTYVLPNFKETKDIGLRMAVIR